MNDGENSPEVIAARAEAEAAIKEEKAASMESPRHIHWLSTCF